MLDSQLAILEHAVALTAVTGRAPGPNGARHPTITPFETYRAEDGLFVLAAGNDALFARACMAHGVPLIGLRGISDGAAPLGGMLDWTRYLDVIDDRLAAALDVRHKSREAIRERVEDTGRHLVHRMEKYLNTLGTIAAAGPLLGLFGTVVGMIQMFLGILDHGIGDVNQLAGGIGKALVCTAMGMIVAIPALMFHRYFRGRIAGNIVDMEHEAMQLLDVLEARENRARV